MYWQPTLLKDLYDYSLKNVDADESSCQEFLEDRTESSEARMDLEIPSHACMKLVSASEQKFSGWSRWLITMEKVRNFTDDVAVPNQMQQKIIRHFGDDLFKRNRN